MARNCKLHDHPTGGARNCKLKIKDRAAALNRWFPRPISAICNLQFAFCILQLLLIATAGAQQPVQQQRLLDRPPFDQIVLDEENKSATLDVFPLDLPSRPLASVPTSGSINVRLLDRPTDEYSVSWADVARVRVFEELLLDEARRLTAAGNFDEAYDYFAKLSTRYSSLPGLNEAISDYLRHNALALYKANQHDRALALLLTLRHHNPKYAGLASAIETVAGEVIQRYLRDGNYAAARGVLDLWQNQFRGLAVEPAAQWQRRFEAAAARQVEEATRLVREKKYVAARKALGNAMAIWPKLDTANAVLAQIQREFPFVTVGVLEAAPRMPKRRIDSWPALRASRLTQRLLAEQVDFGSEGGVYHSPFGKLVLDESGRELSLELDSSTSGRLTADALARYLLAMAKPGSPHFRDDFGSLLTGASISPPSAVRLHFSRVSVRPEAMLQIPPPDEAAVAADFSIADFTPDAVTFTAGATTGGSSARMKAVVEQTLPDDEAAVAALLAGDVDVLDRVPPWQVERLRGAEGVEVESYRLPTVHVLIPNLSRPLLAKREFRRALCYGIDRRWIVQRVILGGESTAGFDVLSGPFPAGVSLSDPLRYGYNNRLTARSFEPRLAAVLATVAWASVQKPKGPDENSDENAEEIPEMPELTLAHSHDPLARIACQSIKAQLLVEGIPVKLREFTADELAAGEIEYDLRYAELAVWEPLADARLILASGGLAGDIQSPFLDAALRRLDEATNWNDVRMRLAELHEIAHHELPVIPLWQTINYFAYRTSVRGIGQSPITLYQNIEHWSINQAGEVAQRVPSTP